MGSTTPCNISHHENADVSSLNLSVISDTFFFECPCFKVSKHERAVFQCYIKSLENLSKCKIKYQSFMWPMFYSCQFCQANRRHRRFFMGSIGLDPTGLTFVVILGVVGACTLPIFSVPETMAARATTG